MALLLAPVLNTPLLKVPLLLTNVVWTYSGMTPPTRPPQSQEKKRAGVSSDFMGNDKIQALLRVCTATSKYILCGVALAEAGVILAQHFPTGYSNHVLATLLPHSGTHTSTLQLTPISVVGCLLGIAGGFTRAWCHRSLGRFFTWEVAVRDNHQLVTSGPYAIVRHPSYIAWLALLAGNFSLLLSGGSYFVEAGLWDTGVGKVGACAVIAYLSWVSVNLLARVEKEDTMLRREFGKQWEEWERKTPYRLIPFIY